MKTTAAILLAAAFAATPALAQESNPQSIEADRVEISAITVVPNTQYAVLGAIEYDGDPAYRVAAPQGTFINFVPDQIVPVTTDVNEIDTYTYEYNGRTYTNRVVRESADSLSADDIIG